MKLVELFDKLPAPGKSLVNCQAAVPDIIRLEYDSRRVTKDLGGMIYACVKGDNFDGHNFAEDAVSLGAAAILSEFELPVDIPQIVVPRTRAVMGAAASILYGKPSDKLTMIGFTGTNGKTTTSYITRAILSESGAGVGMIGTIVYDDGAQESFADRTTPEGPDIQSMLSRMVTNGAKYCVMEVSSHGLDQGRLEGCLFDRVGFSNLTPEHLEYHENMERYFEAKKTLFSAYVRGGWIGAVSADDEYGRRLISEFGERIRGFAVNLELMPVGRNYVASVVESGINGMSVLIQYPNGRSFTVQSPLIGNFNASNILESVVIGESLGMDHDVIRAGILRCPQIPGRLERHSFSNGVTVFVDYAHSYDGMKQILGTLSGLQKARIRVLWGAGGDRTPLKRPIIGEIMAKMAYHVVITTDNPRSENPSAIACDVESGVKRSGINVRCDTILDRREAIGFILDSAEPGDIVLVAGKGPERFIDFGTHKIPFDDSETVREWAAERSLEVMRDDRA
ncbi:MAG: UDP-N-acetylmuramoyl-L-alanyl-D-glutamate--2,6-diaminopimelate ligase [Synergistaceae bacterium]|nr:UDP-N-acetylmuramoyl-L-alanyl-D-glutamate--2,6-diaminopimelate ligase [Synergistaceae bacterium]